ncbi:SRPBCC family protein [Amycolatopsis sp. WGS_07]|uniref:SRPBCC family protein n=1 Tax=Amycolatopsis sp. WGS_07 TaxID=3076764 RepID=UPI003872EA13
MNNLLKNRTERGRSVAETIVAAARADVFEACRDVSGWKRFMPAVLDADFVSPADQDGIEVVRITARAKDDTHTWESARFVSPHSDIIRFTRLCPAAPLLKMEGTWYFISVEGGTRVRLSHSFATETADSREFFLAACRANARTDLEGLRRLFETVEVTA